MATKTTTRTKRKRIIYQNQSLFSSPTGALGPDDINQIYRVQEISHSVEVNRQDVNEFGKLSSISKEIVEAPTVNLDFSYFVVDGANEANGLGFTISGYNAESETNFLSGIMSRDGSEEKNYYIMITPPGKDASQNFTYNQSQYNNMGVIGIGNGFLTNYSFSAAVGEIPNVDVSVEASNVRFDVSGSGFSNPAINFENGKPVNQEVQLPTSTTGELASYIVRPGDITLNFDADELSQGGAVLPGMNTQKSKVAIQSVNFDLPLPRTPLQSVSSVFPKSRELDFPITVSVTANALLADISSGDLNSLICSNEKGRDISIKLHNACKDKELFNLSLRNASLDSQGMSSSIGDNKSVDLTFSAQIGGPQDIENGLFVGSKNPSEKIDPPTQEPTTTESPTTESPTTESPTTESPTTADPGGTSTPNTTPLPICSLEDVCLITTDKNGSLPQFENLSFTQSDGTNTYTAEHHNGLITMRRTDEYSEGEPIRWTLQQAGSWLYRAKNDYDTTCPSTHIGTETTQTFIKLDGPTEVVFEISDQLCPDTPTTPDVTTTFEPPTTTTNPTTTTTTPTTTTTTPTTTTLPPITTTDMPSTPPPPSTTVAPTQPPASAQFLHLQLGDFQYFLSTVGGGCASMSNLNCDNFEGFVSADVSGGIHNSAPAESFAVAEFDRIADDNFDFSSIGTQGEQRIIYASGMGENAGSFRYFQINVSGDGVQAHGKTWHTVYGSAAEGGFGPAPQGEGFGECTEINDDPCSDAR